MTTLPRLLFTLGDVAGIGPEIMVKAWCAPQLHAWCRPVVVGDAACLSRTIDRLQLPLKVRSLNRLTETAGTAATDCIDCLQGTKQDLSQVVLGRVQAEAGQASYDFVCTAIDQCLAANALGIVTAPLHKGSLHAAGVSFPGHTEILAERTGTKNYAMMLYGEGIGVTHVTLHMALRHVFPLIRPKNILAKIELTARIMRQLKGRAPKIGVCALNPHASDGGLFGEEETQMIAPAVEHARERGLDVSGPWPSDTLFGRAKRGEFDGIVAMYHDQGHIAMKLLAGYRAVNISLGLPIVRTSVAHGTAYDIADKGIADPTSLLEAARVAAAMASKPSAGQEWA
jgi:4-hydroxythreonine-4-phosphate dehydrogenase